jgi:hypothetical protein
VRAFTANFTDLTAGSAMNPKGVWSPAFLALKLALDRGEQPDTVIQALYDWLSQRHIQPSEVDTILDFPPDKAYEALVGMVSREMKPEGLPHLVQQTLRRAIEQIAGNYVTKQQSELDLQRAKLASIRDRFNVESAEGLVAALLD